MPAGATLNVVVDRSEFIRESIDDVNFTLILSIALVVGVILIFLRNIRATLVTALVLPASVLGTFAVMHMLGFSLNNLSLMAITLAVGFVVDDAIVVLENITRHMEMGKDRMTASLEGAREISSTVMTMTISLVVVFVPIMFMEGMVGRLFREFAVTVGVAVLISGMVSLSITPMLCSRLLKAIACARPGIRLVRARIRWGAQLVRDESQVGAAFSGFTLMGSLVVLLFMGVLYQTVQKGFIPRQDTGVINGNTRAREGTTFTDMVRNQQAIAEVVSKNENVEGVMSTAGQGVGGTFGDNVGRLIIRLKEREHRPLGADGVIQQLRRDVAHLQGVRMFLSNPPAIRIGGTLSTSDYVFTLDRHRPQAAVRPGQELEARLKTLPQLQDVATNLELRNPEIQLNIMRDRASALGVIVAADRARAFQCIRRPQGQHAIRRSPTSIQRAVRGRPANIRPTSTRWNRFSSRARRARWSR